MIRIRLSTIPTEDYFGGSYGFGNDIIIKNYQTFSGLYTGMYAIYGDNREFYNGQQRFLLYHFHIADPIRFENKFRMTLDNMGWTDRVTMITPVLLIGIRPCRPHR